MAKPRRTFLFLQSSESKAKKRTWRQWLEPAFYALCVVLLAWQAIGVLIPSAVKAWQDTGRSSISASKNNPQAAPLSVVTLSLEDIRKQLEARNSAQLAASLKEIEDEIDRRAGAEEKLMDRELTLVSLYTVLLGLASLFTLANARSEAKEQLEKLEAEAADRLREIQESFPEFRAMHKRVQEILIETNRIFGSQSRSYADWTDDAIDEVNESTRQRILTAEMTIAGLSAFSLESSPAMRSSLVGVYNALARIYLYWMKRSATPNRGESEYERALMYAGRSLELAPEKAGVWRIRGAIQLARYELFSALDGAMLQALNPLLNAAESDFKQSIDRAEPGTVDAGAYYNLSLVYWYRRDLDGAIRQSRELLKRKDKISELHRTKYLPDAYLNLGCYLTRKAAGVEGEARQRLFEEATQTILQGISDFRGVTGLENAYQQLSTGIERELRAGGDLSALPETHKRKILKAITTAAQVEEPGK